MGRKPIIPLCFILLGLQGAVFGAEPVSEWEKQECPQCFHEYIKYSYQVFLPDAMRDALKKYSPTFRIFDLGDFAEELRLKLQPWSTNLTSYSAVFRDFNGDGRFDAAVLGEYSEKQSGTGTQYEDSNVTLDADKKHIAVLAILSQGTTNYTVVEIARVGRGSGKIISSYLYLSPPGKVSEIGSDGSEVFEFKNYGISLSAGVGVTVYYWDDKKKRFKEVVTGGM